MSLSACSQKAFGFPFSLLLKALDILQGLVLDRQRLEQHLPPSPGDPTLSQGTFTAPSNDTEGTAQQMGARPLQPKTWF